MPCSKSVTRSTSPVIRTQPSTSSDGCLRSTTVEALAGRARAAPASAAPWARRPAGPTGGGSTRAGAPPSASGTAPQPPASPARPPAWSKWPWLSTTPCTAVRSTCEPVGVGDQRVRRQPGVEQHRGGAVAAADGDQRGESVLGDQPGQGRAADELRRRGRPDGERRPSDPLVADQQAVEGVVDQDGHRHLVDRGERDRIDRRARRRTRDCGDRRGPVATLTHDAPPQQRWAARRRVESIDASSSSQDCASRIRPIHVRSPGSSSGDRGSDVADRQP